MKRKIELFFIAPYPWNSNYILFRRDRMAKYFRCENIVSNIYWIYPDYTPLFMMEKSLEVVSEEEKIRSIRVPDFKGASHFRSFNRYTKLFKELDDLIFSKNDTIKILIYTVPMFKEIANEFKWDKVVYDCSDLWISTIKKRSKFNLKGALIELRRRKIKETEEHIINFSDHIFSTSEFLFNRIKKITNKTPLLIENGVDINSFNYKEKKESIIDEEVKHPKIGFVGGIKNKIDFTMLYEIAIENPRYSFIIAGPITYPKPKDFQKFINLSNVHYVGAINAEQVPSLLLQLDVGILPYRNIKYNYGITPLKLFEYLAAGIPAVGCGLPSTEKFTQDKVYYHTEVKKDEFIEKINLALKYASNEKYRRLRTEIAAKNDWNKKFQIILDEIIGNTSSIDKG